MKPRSSTVTVTDLFCGAGGSSIGVERAGAELRMALNHWDLAIKVHNTNFPNADHALTDIHDADPARYPTTDVLIASPECTAHALAKGRKRKNQTQIDLFGKDGIDPTEEKSRATMWDVVKWSAHHTFNIVIVENVVDACLYWQPFDEWLGAMSTLGYEHQLVFMNSMFAHPTPQSRDRLYVVFHRRGNRAPDLNFSPPAWCQPCQVNVAGVQSWKRQDRRRGKYGARNQYVYRCPKCLGVVQPYYFAAANCIDWSITGERIGDRKRPLKPKTLERIKYGLERYSRRGAFVASTAGDASFIAGLERPGTAGRVHPVTDPMPTQTGWQDKALVRPPWLMGMHGHYYTYRTLEEAVPTQMATGSTTALITPPFIAEMRGESTTGEITDPLSTVTAGGGHHGLVQPPSFLISPNHRSVRAIPIDEPFPTQTASLQHGLVVPAGGTWNEDARSTNDPMPTQTTREMYGVVQTPAPFLLSYYGERHGTHAIDDPLVTVAARDNHAVVLPEALVGCLRAHDVPASVDQPVPSVVAGGTQHYLLLPYYGSGGSLHGLEEPTRTVSTHDREALLGVAPAVEDCYFRMLSPTEIGRAMAFPDDYQMLGTARERIRLFGNAVTPPAMSWLFERCVATLAG